MFKPNRTISSPMLFEYINNEQKSKQYSSINLDLSSDIQKAITNPLLSTSPNISIGWTDVPTVKSAENIISSTIMPISSSAVAINSIQTYNINQAFAQLKSSIITRGMTYANNTLATRRGYIAENFIAETYNIDATIKKIPDRAVVPESTQNASPDIIYDGGKKTASLKFYQDAASSAKAQTNPKYENQDRIIPSDQVDEGKRQLSVLANKNEVKGRMEAANLQRKTSQKLDATIKGSDGAESTPLTKENSDELAKAFKVDKAGNKIFDEAQFDSAFKKTGITKKVQLAKVMNELKGIGIAAAIGLGTGFAIGFIVTLAQNGLNPNSIRNAFVAATYQSFESAATTTVGALLGVITHKATESLAQLITTHMGSDIASSTVQNISTICNMSVVGTLTVIAFSIYQFTKLKLQGYNTKECLLRTGKTAALSLSILLISIIAQGLIGGYAGMVVSITSGIILTGYTIVQNKHNNIVARKITYYSIELCRPKIIT